MNQARQAVEKWRRLSNSAKVQHRRAVVVDRVVSSMAMEGEPVSKAWEMRAKSRRLGTSTLR